MRPFPSFGTKQERTLHLINEEEVQAVPGPGKYDVLPLNIDDLLRQCDDKKLAKEILANLQERMPSKVFQSKEPRIAVFPDAPKPEEGLNKYYNQDSQTIGQGQLKISQKRLEQMIYKLRKDYQSGV